MPELTYSVLPKKRIGPLYTETRYKDLKDPCIAYDGVTWHIYGSGGDTTREEWDICHATAPSIEGPWTEAEQVVLRGVEGPHVAAPSVIYDFEDKLFHMAVQKDFMDVGEGIAYLVSADGTVFTKMRTIMRPSGEAEAGLYDPHFSEIAGKKYMVYSGVPELTANPSRPYVVPQPDIYLSRSTTERWVGYWKRVRAILRHEDISWHHNDREHPDYEWGIEGPQLVELPDGKVLLNATCFLQEGRRGTRQRVFFALADKVEGPYRSIGPVLPTDAPGVKENSVAHTETSASGKARPETETDAETTAIEKIHEWENGENGHASAIIHESQLYLFYQARSQAIEAPKEANDWRYGIAVYDLKDILDAASSST